MEAHMSTQFTFIKEVVITDDPNQLVTYVDSARASASPEEFILHFGLRKTEEPHIATGVAKIYLSLPHAKRLALALAQVIKGYEDAFGKIETDPAARLTQDARNRLELEPKQKGDLHGKD